MSPEWNPEKYIAAIQCNRIRDAKQLHSQSQQLICQQTSDNSTKVGMENKKKQGEGDGEFNIPTRSSTWEYEGKNTKSQGNHHTTNQNYGYGKPKSKPKKST